MKHLSPRIILITLLTWFISSPALAGDGDIVKVNAKGSATDTLKSLKQHLKQKRFKIFSEYDHGNGKSIKQVIAFGKEDHHSRIMWHDSAAALELPFTIAVFQDDVGTQVIYRKPSSLRQSYSVENCSVLDILDDVMAELAQTAAQ